MGLITQCEQESRRCIPKSQTRISGRIILLSFHFDDKSIVVPECVCIRSWLCIAVIRAQPNPAWGMPPAHVEGG